MTQSTENTNEFRTIIEKFAASGWDLIDEPSKAWLEDETKLPQLLEAITKADEECGSCGCEFDPLYKRALQIAALQSH